MSAEPVPETPEGQLWYLVGSVKGLQDSVATIHGDMREERDERRRDREGWKEDLRALKTELVEEFDRIETKVDTVAARTDALEAAQMDAAGYRRGVKAARDALLAAVAGAAGWFGKDAI